ncbi:MAG TPA: hypothetical protein VFP12_01970 [Allosphingosinicella sp.]|nr:hypothetical protein [Allosphingosinicella sp.]
MDQSDSRLAHSPEPASDDAASPFNRQPDEAADRLAFEPVPLRYRSDGLTPEKQRAYVEALADCGIAREAAARVGVSETSIARVRRRSDAVSFDRACEAAHVFGARRLRSVAWERAVGGTLRNRYYRGELVGQDRVYDNRLLTYLLGKVERLLEPPAGVRAICDDWEAHMDALEQGLPPPDPKPARNAARPEFTGYELNEDEDGIWWTHFPPPEGFDGEEYGQYGDESYKRTLSPREQAVVDAQVEEEDAEALAGQAARRDRFFGFAGDEISAPGEAEPSELSEPSEEEDSGEGPLEYKSLEPPSFRRKPESMNTAAHDFPPPCSWIPDQVRDDGSRAAPPYPRRRFPSIPEPARLWGEHG